MKRVCRGIQTSRLQVIFCNRTSKTLVDSGQWPAIEQTLCSLPTVYVCVCVWMCLYVLQMNLENIGWFWSMACNLMDSMLLYHSVCAYVCEHMLMYMYVYMHIHVYTTHTHTHTQSLSPMYVYHIRILYSSLEMHAHAHTHARWAHVQKEPRCEPHVHVHGACAWGTCMCMLMDTAGMCL